TPEVDQAAVDLEIDLVEMPGGMGLGPALSKIGRDLGPEVVGPATHGLVGHGDPAFGQQILDIAEAQGEPNIQPNRLLDDLRREAVAAVADFSHARWLPPGLRSRKLATS